MKNIYLFIFFFTFLSCEDDYCQLCTVIIEDNFIEADRECLGLPNVFPDGYQVFTEFTEEYCGQDLDDLYLREGEILEYFCPGVVASQITYIICE